ncbi:MAG: hypothetical protein MUD12_17250 [Spirochaetes bacterium]|jgi:hypothetical protein|nr:hypothetical protein [Spirochaetota bacterium]
MNLLYYYAPFIVVIIGMPLACILGLVLHKTTSSRLDIKGVGYKISIAGSAAASLVLAGGMYIAADRLYVRMNTERAISVYSKIDDTRQMIVDLEACVKTTPDKCTNEATRLSENLKILNNDLKLFAPVIKENYIKDK